MPEPQTFTDAPLASFVDAPLEDAHSETSKPQSSSGALWLQAASKAIPAAEQVVKAGLAAPNAPRVIQRTIGAAVRGASTAAGAAIGGVPGAVGGAAMSEGLTPTQQTIRGWLGRAAAQTAEKAAPATSDAVVNYIEAMGANPENLSGAALEYAKKAGRAILYDSSGRASLVPSQAAAETAATAAPTAAPAASSLLGKAAHGLSVLSAVQGGLDLAQMADPKRTDIGFLGVGASQPTPTLPTADSLKPELAAMTASIDKGVSPSHAAYMASGGSPAKFSVLMTAYMKSRQVK